jgi:hypothetical protein
MAALPRARAPAASGPRLQLQLALATVASSATPDGPKFVGRWVGPTQSLPASQLPQIPLLGNGHIGVLLDSRITSTDSSIRADYILHNSTRCGADLGIIGQNVTLEQCEANCTASAKCGAFSYCNVAAGATGCAVAGATSRCFQYADMQQSNAGPGDVGWTSGLRLPARAPSAPSVPSNVTLDLWVGSNAMWAVNECPRPGTSAHRGNTNSSAPFNPHWAPPFAPACARRIAVGGLSVVLPARGIVNISMEQHIGHPRLRATVSSELGTAALVVFMHPVENLLVANISSSETSVVRVSTWAVNSTSSPSHTTVRDSVGIVTRHAVAVRSVALHNSTRCGADLGIIGQNVTLEQCEANCTASTKCGAFSYCNVAAGATGCAVAGATSRCFQFADMSVCTTAKQNIGWTSGLRAAQRPKVDKQIQAALATASEAIESWMLSDTAAGFVEGKYMEGRAVLSSAVSLSPGKIVSLITAFADNSLVGRPTGATEVVTNRAASTVAAAVGPHSNTPTAVDTAIRVWWTEYWQQSAISLPTRSNIERFWFGAQYIGASMASTNPEVPPSGLYGPWVTSDQPSWGGDYTLDYNQVNLQLSTVATCIVISL